MACFGRRTGVLTNFTTGAASGKLRSGVLAGQMDGFAALLWERGYGRRAGQQHLRTVADFSQWLEGNGYGVGDIDELHAKRFLRFRRRRRRHHGDWAALRLLMKHLREVGIVSPPSPAVVHDEQFALEQTFATYLLQEKGVSQATKKHYAREIHAFLRYQFRQGPVVLSTLCGQDLHRFVLSRAQHLGPPGVKLTVTALRAFCRFLRFRGDIANDLASSVFTVPNWRLTTLPKSISQEQIEQLLVNCNQRTPIGRRDYAILLLLARLGLRAGEVAALTLDDVNWDVGELAVLGKGSRRERIPLPHDVGTALAAYLRRDRPRCATRRVFIRAKAPLVGFASSAAVSIIVAKAIARSGLNPPSRGAHLLRYSLATNVLRRGGSLAEVADLLRHRHPDTTALYAKVDFEALRSVVQPWPGVR
jgi:integrase/recombinase XerD